MAGCQSARAGDAALTPRARARAILRAGTRRPPVTIFMPLAHAVAAHIESLPLVDFVRSPQKLANGLVALREILQTDALTVACAAGIEVEALGARPVAPDADDLATRLAGGERLAVALEAARRLRDARGEPLVIAGLTGPQALTAELRALGALPETSAEAAIEIAGRVALETARLFLGAGCGAVVIIEPVDDGAPPGWTSAVGTIAKLARFYDALPLVTFAGAAPPALPSAAIACPAASAASAKLGPSGVALSTDEREWRPPATPPTILTTRGDIRADAAIAQLQQACAALAAAPLGA